MRVGLRAALTGALLLAGSGGALADSCWTHRALCEAVCTPDRIARYYAGSEERCSSSCYPRWSQCMRTGWWADLERLRTGGWEPATRF